MAPAFAQAAKVLEPQVRLLKLDTSRAPDRGALPDPLDPHADPLLRGGREARAIRAPCPRKGYRPVDAPAPLIPEKHLFTEF